MTASLSFRFEVSPIRERLAALASTFVPPWPDADVTNLLPRHNASRSRGGEGRQVCGAQRRSRRQRGERRAIYSLASTGLFSVPGVVNLNFHAIVHRDAIYFKDSINPSLPLISQGCYIKRVYALGSREQVCTFRRGSQLKGLQLVWKSHKGHENQTVPALLSHPSAVLCHASLGSTLPPAPLQGSDSPSARMDGEEGEA